SVSGNLAYSGRLTRAGRFEFISHSGNVRLALSDAVGFDLTAGSFSGSIRSDLPLTLSDRAVGPAGRPRVPPPGPPAPPERAAPPVPPAAPAPPIAPRGLNRSMRATLGDGSAVLIIRTFSGDIVIEKAPR